MESVDLLILGGGPAGLSVTTGYRNAGGAVPCS
jgi:thioredoxin reductase